MIMIYEKADLGYINELCREHHVAIKVKYITNISFSIGVQPEMFKYSIRLIYFPLETSRGADCNVDSS